MKILYVLATGFVIALSINTAIFADLVVTKSNIPRYKVGTKLPDNTKLNIPENGKIKLLQKPGNKQYTLEGRYCGTLGNYKRRKQSWWERVFGSEKLVNTETDEGGTRNPMMPESTC